MIMRQNHFLICWTLAPRQGLTAGQWQTSFVGSYRKSLRDKAPSSRFDSSFTGICGAMLFSSTSQFSIGAAPQAVSAASQSGFRPKRCEPRWGMPAPLTARSGTRRFQA
jgi:hypothetical protein